MHASTECGEGMCQFAIRRERFCDYAQHAAQIFESAASTSPIAQYKDCLVLGSSNGQTGQPQWVSP